MCTTESEKDRKESACNAGDPGLIPGLGQYPGEGNMGVCIHTHTHIYITESLCCNLKLIHIVNERFVCCSVTKSCPTLRNSMDSSPPGSSVLYYISQSLLKFVSIESVVLSNHLILCRPLLLLPSIFPSIGVFSNKLALCIRWPKYWSFSNSPSKEYFKVDFP